jgi:hypothetical protein
MTLANTRRKQAGGFQKGQSGNPRGRPVGSRNNATLACEVLLEGRAKALRKRRSIWLWLASGRKSHFRQDSAFSRQKKMFWLTVPDEETASRLEDVVAEHLKRFAFRESLEIVWQRA